jgi:hypothetical protein
VVVAKRCTIDANLCTILVVIVGKCCNNQYNRGKDHILQHRCINDNDNNNYKCHCHCGGFGLLCNAAHAVAKLFIRDRFDL